MVNVRLVSLVAFLILVAVLAVLIVNRSIIGSGWPAQAVQALAVALMVWSRVVFGARSFHAAAEPTAGELVTSGPYRFLRHPIYAAILWFLWPAILSHLSAPNLLLGIIASGAVALRISAEERALRARYPAYAEYARRTSRLIPYVF